MTNEVFDTKEQTAAEAQAEAQYQSICSMLDAVDVDYDRLEELRDECEELMELRKEDLRLRQAQCQEGASKSVTEALVSFECEKGDRLRELEDSLSEEMEELETLEADAGDCNDEDDARQRISEDPLEVTVRSGWVTMGEEMTADDFAILLCTGGPAVRIRGELDNYGTPCRAWMEYQDWGTPWTQYFGAEQSRLLAYAKHFFG